MRLQSTPATPKNDAMMSCWRLRTPNQRDRELGAAAQEP